MASSTSLIVMFLKVLVILYCHDSSSVGLFPCWIFISSMAFFMLVLSLVAWASVSRISSGSLVCLCSSSRSGLTLVAISLVSTAGRTRSFISSTPCIYKYCF